MDRDKIKHLLNKTLDKDPQVYFEQFMSKCKFFISNKNIKINKEYSSYYYSLVSKKKSYKIKFVVTKDGLMEVNLFHKGKRFNRKTRDKDILLYELKQEIDSYR